MPNVFGPCGALLAGSIKSQPTKNQQTKFIPRGDIF